jgi:hypothetical protein
MPSSGVTKIEKVAVAPDEGNLADILPVNRQAQLEWRWQQHAKRRNDSHQLRLLVGSFQHNDDEADIVAVLGLNRLRQRALFILRPRRRVAFHQPVAIGPDDRALGDAGWRRKKGGDTGDRGNCATPERPPDTQGALMHFDKLPVDAAAGRNGPIHDISLAFVTRSRRLMQKCRIVPVYEALRDGWRLWFLFPVATSDRASHCHRLYGRYRGRNGQPVLPWAARSTEGGTTTGRSSDG